MLMDFELYQAVNNKINDIVKTYSELYKINIGMIISTKIQSMKVLHTL